jgi:hypothetical protein
MNTILAGNTCLVIGASGNFGRGRQKPSYHMGLTGC